MGLQMHGRIFASMVLAFALIAGAGSPKAENRVALIIANGKYEHAPELFNPIHDGALLKSTLEAQKFQVASVVNANQQQMKSAIADFASKLKESGSDTVALLYYAGHGVQVNGVNYLIPVDARIDDEAHAVIYAVDADEIMKSIALAGSPLNVVILDACRNNPFRGFRSYDGGLAQMDAPKGTIIAFSTAPGKKAKDGPADKNSPYAAALAENLVHPGLTIEEIFKKVRKAVSTATNGYQWPWESTSLVGYFYPAGQLVQQNPDALPRVLILDPIDGAELTGGKATVRVALGASRNPAKSIRVFVNGRPVREELAPIGGAFEVGEKRIEVPLAAGPNELRIVTGNALGERSDVLSLIHQGIGDLDRRGTLYIVAIGVDRAPKCAGCPQLEFAGADARDFAQVVARRLGPEHQKTVAKVLVTGGDEPAAAKIIDALSLLRQAGANDTSVVFFAGSGQSEGGSYRFAASDTEWEEKSGFRASTVVAGSAIQEALETAKGRRLLFIDTSNASGTFVSRLRDASVAEEIFTFTAAVPGQEAMESSQFGHGLFTFALLEGLSGKAAQTGKPEITAAGLAEYIRLRVEELSMKTGGTLQAPQYLSSAAGINPVLMHSVPAPEPEQPKPPVPAAPAR